MVRSRWVVAALVSLSAVIALGVYLGGRARDVKLPLPTRQCTVRDTAARTPDPSRTVRLSTRQMANAATIAAVGVRTHMGERAVAVALATALQESRLKNLSGGDRDSVGLFQQRPSQGWGTPAQIRDPRYAAKRFYAALRKVGGWKEMRVTDAAQAVQRSAFPEAYERWTDEAEVLASALTGNSGGAVACTVGDEPAKRGDEAAAALVDGLERDWGQLETVVATEVIGVAVSGGNPRAGWRYAHWLVAYASEHGVRRVQFGDLEWTANDGVWRRVGRDRTPGNGLVVAEVYGNV